ncbi:hypothetical protein YB2330_003944 [Saitoella coloradoensis]
MPHAPFLGLRGKKLVYAITFTCSLGFLLFGYDNGVFSGLTTAPLFLDQFDNPGASMLGFIIAVYELGCLLGALICAVYADHFGRIKVMVAGNIILIIGCVIQTASFGRPELIVGRVVTGVGMGFITSVVPIWQAECTLAHSRGRMIAVQLSMLIVGIVIAYWLDYGCSFATTSLQWRFPIIFQVVFAVAMIGLCCMLPESPRWLAARGRNEEALAILGALRDGSQDDVHVRAEYEEILASLALEMEESGSWKDVFSDNGIKGYQRTIIACAVQAMQEFTGTNIITYYAPYVMVHSVGLDNHQALLLSGGLQLFFLAMSFIPWAIIDKAGRRKLFMFGSTGMGACMLASGLCIYRGGRNNGIGAVVALYLFQGFFTVGWMSNMWCYPSEILPLRLRQRGGALSVVWQWLITFLVVEITPPAISNIGWWTYIIFALLNFGSIGIVWYWFPETAGRSLESVDLLFVDAKNIREVVLRSTGKAEMPVFDMKGAGVELRHRVLGKGDEEEEMDIGKQDVVHVERVVGTGPGGVAV